MALGDLLLRLRMDTADLESDSGKAAHVIERDMERMIVKATAAGQLIGDALGKIAGRFANMAAETLKAGDELSKLSTRSGLTVERLSELKFAGDLADVSMGQIATSLGQFNKALADAQNEGSKIGQTFMALGVDIKAGPQAAFEQFIKSVNQLPDQEQKVAAMRLAFGRAGDALLPMIGNLDEVTERARKLGIVMSTDMARDSERFNDAMKTIAASSQAMLLPTMTRMASAFAGLAENIVAATERGEKWKQILIEIAKVSAANAAAMGLPGADLAARKLFEWDEARRNSGAPGAAIKGESGAGPNADAVACAVSGGKWVNGQCVRGRTGGRAGADPEIEAARIRGMAIVKQDLALQELRVENIKLNDSDRIRQAEETAAQIAASEKATFEDIEAMEAAYYEKGRQLREIHLAQMKEEKQLVKESNTFWHDLGMTFESAFSKAIIGGENLAKVLAGLAKDFAAIYLRETVLKPAATAASGFLKDLNVGASIGGFFKELLPSYDVGTSYVPHDMVAQIHRGEQIIPAGKNAGGGITINSVYNIDSRTDQASIQRIVDQGSQQTIAKIQDSINRGGAFARSIGRA